MKKIILIVAALLATLFESYAQEKKSKIPGTQNITLSAEKWEFQPEKLIS